MNQDSIRSIINDLWNSRELINQLVKRDVKLRYRQAVMGFGWALLMPILTISAGLVIKGALAQAGGSTPSMAGIVLKSWAWAFFAGSMNFATMSLLGNINIVTKIWFPREVLPLSSVLAQAVDGLVGLAFIALITPFLGATLGWSLIWFPLLVLLLILLTMGLGFVFSCANIFFRDMKYILQVLLTFGIFFTPVFLEPEQMGRFAKVIMLNPLSPILEGMRLAATAGHNLAFPLVDAAGKTLWQPWWLGYSAFWAGLTLWVGLRLFRAGSAFFAEVW